MVILGLSIVPIFYYSLRNDNVAKGLIVTNGHECAEIAKNILIAGGSAVDAAISAALCEGVALPQSTGIGGGSFITIYTKHDRKIHMLNAREVAPSAATKDMFDNNPGLRFFNKNTM